MKYSASNKPLVCMQTQSRCYIWTNKNMRPKGILLHSTGANNPTLKRYVQPSDNAPDRDVMLKLLGVNRNGNDWNHEPQSAGLNAWIGKTAAGEVATVQSMPWTYKPWGCGSGPRGSCNSGWIQFEICEDGLTDKAYFSKCYDEAVELVAYLCQLYGLNPHGTTTHNGVKVPVILDHTTSWALGLGSNHGDVKHWFRRHGKSIESFRADVAQVMKCTTTPKPTTTATGSAAGLEYPAGAIKHREAWNILRKAGLTEVGTAALMGNLYAESGLAANNLQNNGNRALGLTDAEFTARLDNGSYTRERFIRDGYGYGLAQWTYHTRKADFYDYMTRAGKGYGDEQTQLAYVIHELKTGYKPVWQALTGGAQTLREASDIVMTRYEAPADQSEDAKKTRAKYGKGIYKRYASQPTDKPTTPKPATGYKVRVTASALNIRSGPGTGYKIEGTIHDRGIYHIVAEQDGWGKLLSGAGWISLNYTERI